MSTEDDKDDDEVGYGKPPKKNQFKKGQSGNPKGRPKKQEKEKASPARELCDFLEEEVAVTVNGKALKVSRFAEYYISLYARARAGEPLAARLFHNMIKEVKLLDPATLVTPSAFLVLPPPLPQEEVLKRLEERQRPFREGTWKPPIDDNVVDFDERKKKAG